MLALSLTHVWNSQERVTGLLCELFAVISWLTLGSRSPNAGHPSLTTDLANHALRTATVSAKRATRRETVDPGLVYQQPGGWDDRHKGVQSVCGTGDPTKRQCSCEVSRLSSSCLYSRSHLFCSFGGRRASDLAQPPHPKPVSKILLITSSLSFFSPARCFFLVTGLSSAQKLLAFRCHFPSTSVCRPRKYSWSTIPGSVACPASSRGLS
jgi:hypothetical protein